MDGAEIERKVIETLVAYPRRPDTDIAAIHTVDKAMGWTTKQTTAFVDDLLTRGLIELKTGYGGTATGTELVVGAEGQNRGLQVGASNLVEIRQ